MAKGKSSEDSGLSEAQIAVHWKEEDYVYPSAQFIAQANMTDPAIFERFGLDNFPECFKEYADLLSWYDYWHTTLDTSDAPCWKWFVGGKINASYNCIDRHLKKHKNKAAIHFVPEPEDEAPAVITYQELYVRVNEVAKKAPESLHWLAVAPGGEAHVTWLDMRDQSTRGQDLYYARVTNGKVGKNVKIAAQVCECCAPGIGLDSKGNPTVSVREGGTKQNRAILVMRSTDGGKTWKAPAPINQGETKVPN